MTVRVSILIIFSGHLCHMQKTATPPPPPHLKEYFKKFVLLSQVVPELTDSYMRFCSFGFQLEDKQEVL